MSPRQCAFSMTKTRLKRKTKYFPTAEIDSKFRTKYAQIDGPIMKLKISSPCGSSVEPLPQRLSEVVLPRLASSESHQIKWASPSSLAPSDLPLLKMRKVTEPKGKPPTVAVVLALISDESRPELMPGEETKQL